MGSALNPGTLFFCHVGDHAIIADENLLHGSIQDYHFLFIFITNHIIIINN
jgi:hypothetical protein